MTIRELPIQHTPLRNGPDEPITYPLQPIIATRPILESELYFRTSATPSAEEPFHLPEGCSVDFDTFINAFHEWHWRAHTNVSSVALVLRTEGAATVSVYRTLAAGQRTKLAERTLRDVGTTTLPIAGAESAPGRLSFTLQAHVGGLTLNAAQWATPDLPSRPVSLDVVICTYNNAKLVMPMLDRLLGSAGACEALAHVTVVDQGTQRLKAQPDLPQTVIRALQSGLLSLFEQDNLGGSGGFTRGIMEALRRADHGSGCTHVLLMDDDVQFEGRLLSQLSAFLAYARADVVIGGAMMDMFRPHHLFAYSEYFDVRTAHVERQVPFDLDMRRSDNLAKLEAARTGNYNGWFACCFPLASFRTHGLPLPFFIRSDDCEYGMRLTRAGVPLVHLPGFFVWHEPFWNKPRAWIEYYTSRNHAIVADLGSPRPVLMRPLRRLSEFWYYITIYQYDTALAMCLATEHYCRGPEVVFSAPQKRHAEILAEFTSVERAVVDEENAARGCACPKPGERPASRTSRWLPYAVSFLSNIHWNLLGRVCSAERQAPALQAVADGHLWWGPFHRFAAVLVDTPSADAARVLRHDAVAARRLTRRMLRATIVHLIRLRPLHAAYKAAVARYTTERFWQGLIGIAPPR